MFAALNFLRNLKQKREFVRGCSSPMPRVSFNGRVSLNFGVPRLFLLHLFVLEQLRSFVGCDVHDYFSVIKCFNLV